jgi:hypothetical protein
MSTLEPVRTPSTQTHATRHHSDPVWAQLSMVDLGAAATLNGATRSTRSGLAVLDVQSGDTPQATVSLGQTGTMVTVTRETAWDFAGGKIAAFYRGLDGTSLIGFAQGSDSFARKRDAGGTVRSVGSTGDAFASGAVHVHTHTWTAAQMSARLDGQDLGSVSPAGAWDTGAGVSVLYDWQNAGRELEGEGALLYTSDALSVHQIAALDAELRDIAA